MNLPTGTQNHGWGYLDDLYKEEDKKPLDKDPLTCKHNFKEYIGFSEAYRYCENCGVKYHDIDLKKIKM